MATWGKKPKLTGAKRMMELGKRPVQCWFSKSDYAKIELEARRTRQAVATFVRRAAQRAANVF